MKRIINCVLAVLISVGLTSCSTVQDNEIYQDWQQHAYSVYNMPVPKESNLFPVSLSSNKPANRGTAPRNAAPQAKVKYERLSEAEQSYIASHYGL